MPTPDLRVMEELNNEKELVAFIQTPFQKAHIIWTELYGLQFFLDGVSQSVRLSFLVFFFPSAYLPIVSGVGVNLSSLVLDDFFFDLFVLFLIFNANSPNIIELIFMSFSTTNLCSLFHRLKPTSTSTTRRWCIRRC
jgi:membrane-associated HD superfamily phosphohydrolase